ncbi:flippase [Chloroflexota bacterium]
MDITKSIASVLVTNVLILLLGIPTSIIIARVLGPHGKGIYTLVTLVPSLLLQLGNIGLASANTYFVGRKRFSLADITSNSLVFGLAASALLAILFLIAYQFFLYPFFTDVKPLFLYLILLGLPFSFIYIYFLHILLAKLKVKEYNSLRILQTLLMLIGVALLLLFFNGEIFSLILLSLFISGIAFGIVYFLVNRMTKVEFLLKTNILKESLKYGVKVHLSNIFTFLNYRLDMLLVSYFIGATQVGFYSLAVGIAEMVWFIQSAVKTIIFPVVASADPSKSSEIAAEASRHTLFLSLLACLGLGIIAKWAIEVVYGSEFLPSYMPLLILLPGIIAVSVGAVAAAYLAGVGKPIFATYASLVSMGVNVGLNLIFIPKWGTTGAALATSISYTLVSFILIFYFSNSSGVKLKDILLVRLGDIKLYLEIAKRLAHRVNSLDGGKIS